MVLVTTKGAVPLATLEINCGVVILLLDKTLVVPKLPTLALPLTFAVPVIFAPVSLMIIMLLLLAVNVRLALAVIVILLLPFCINPLLIVVIFPVVAISVVVPKLPVLAFPVTAKLINVPRLVIFG